MQSVLITNGGPHKSAAWAEATASHILEIADHISGSRRAGAIKLQAVIIDILESAHRTVKHGERAKLAEANGSARLAHVHHDPKEHVNLDITADAIIAAAVGTPWEADFAFKGQPADDGNASMDIEPRPKIASFKELLIGTLTQHFASSMHIERSWHADRNPSDPQCRAFKQRHHNPTADK